MDFTLTDDQQLLVQSIGELMGQESWDTYFQECDEKHEYPERWVAELAKIGIDSMMLPEANGGMGADWTTLAAVWEELGRLGGPTYVLYQLPSLEAIFRVGSEEQAAKVSALIGTGKQIWNSAMTEPGAGSSLREIATTYARRDGKVYLKGQKIFITSSAHVPYLVVMARNADKSDQFTEWFVDMSKPGITKSPLDKLCPRNRRLRHGAFRRGVLRLWLGTLRLRGCRQVRESEAAGWAGHRTVRADSREDLCDAHRHHEHAQHDL
jgi:crotonobetainyl-CoA dehydrogenase